MVVSFDRGVRLRQAPRPRSARRARTPPRSSPPTRTPTARPRRAACRTAPRCCLALEACHGARAEVLSSASPAAHMAAAFLARLGYVDPASAAGVGDRSTTDVAMASATRRRRHPRAHARDERRRRRTRRQIKPDYVVDRHRPNSLPGALNARHPARCGTRPRLRAQRDARRVWTGREVDVLVVGGGVTGAGIALDAATRGLLGRARRGDATSPPAPPAGRAS